MDHDNAAVEALRKDRNAFDMACYGLGMTAKGKNITCPWHDDQNPSASVLEAANGHWRIWCHVCDKGGDVFDLREKLTGQSVADQFRSLSSKSVDIIKPTKNKSAVFQSLEQLKSCLYNVVATYSYNNQDTNNCDMVVFRLIKDDKKTFRQAHQSADGWHMKAPDKPWPIYNRSRLLGATSVVIVEGEKDVQTLHKFGIVATTSPGGASSANHADWSMLAGKTVTLWPDNDEAGAKYMADVKGTLEKLDPKPVISRISLIGLNMPAKGDVTDLVESMDAQDHDTIKGILQTIIDEAQPSGASSDSMRLLEDKISGKYKAVNWPWDKVSKLSRSLLPGTVTVLCGSPGSNKSFLTLEAAAHWFAEGVPLSLYELEEDRTYHLDRAIAQVAGNAQITDPDWIMAHPSEARLEYERRKEWLDKFGSIISEAPDKLVTLKEISDWIDARAQAGSRLIIIDPISATEATQRQWADDLVFIMRSKMTARKYGCSILLVMHPRKGKISGAPGLDDLAGGAAYQRFSQNVMWLERLEELTQIQVDGRPKVATHLLKILKTRNGPGSGANLGYLFNAQTLRFTEIGLVEKKRKEACEQPKREVTSKYNRMNDEPNSSEDLFA